MVTYSAEVEVMSAAPQQNMPLPPHESRAVGVLVEVYLLLVVAFLLVALRVHVRIKFSKNWGWDDTTIILALLLLVAEAVITQLAVNAGYGRHIVYLPNPEASALGVLKWIPFFQILNIACTLLVKLSISVYILRIKSDKVLKWTLATLMLLMTLVTIAAIAVVAAMCIPLRKFWEPETPGTCLPTSSVDIVGYTQAAFTIVVDICLTATPLIVLWNVKIDIRRKILICLLMSLGLIATVSTGLKLAYISELSSPDFTYDCVPLTTVSVLEVSAGIIAACIPACIPILRLGSRSTKASGDRTSSFYLRSPGRSNKSTTSAFRPYTALDEMPAQSGNTRDKASTLRVEAFVAESRSPAEGEEIGGIQRT